MKCIILAAGYATRLYPLTLNFPKALLKVGKHTILDRLIDDLDQCEAVSEFVVVSNARYYDAFSNWRDQKVDAWHGLKSPRATINVLNDGSETNDDRLGAVKDLLFALEHYDAESQWLVAAGDNILDFSLTTFIDYFQRREANCIMRYREEDVCKLRRCGVVEIGEDDRVLSMEEKPQAPKSQWCVPPFYAYQCLTAQAVRAALADGCGWDAPGNLPSYLASRTPLYAMEMPGKRHDVGDPQSYREAQELFGSDPV
ncbi:MAG: sugar phosphate nucleotidyltransferase [Planctomycetia bacterium]|nr:sugar phosphate nucleotidyltransferase [Planctomycetia bacterium]